MLADFVAEFTHFKQIKGLVKATVLLGFEQTIPWVLNIHGLANAYGNEANKIFKTLDETVINQCLLLGFQAINNEIEYEALIAKLKLAWSLEASRIRVSTIPNWLSIR